MQSERRLVWVSALRKLRSKNLQELVYYGVPTILSKASSLLLLPLYTRLISPEEFGLVSVALVVAGSLRMVTFLNVDTLYVRYGYDEGAGNRMGALVRLHLILVFFLLPFCTFPAMRIAHAFSPTLPALFIVIAIATVAASSIGAPVVGFLRIERRAGTLAFYQLFSFFLEIFAVLFCLFVLKLGALSILLGALVGDIFFFPLAVPFFKNGLKQPVSRQVSIQILQSLVTAAPATIAMWGFGAFDRLLLSYFRGAEETGIYSAGFQMGSILVAFAIIAGKQWQVMTYETRKVNGPARERVTLLFGHALPIFLSLGALVAVLASPITRIFLGPKYVATELMIPVIVLTAVLRIPEFFWEYVCWADHRRRRIIATNGIAVVLMILGHIILIPRYGGVGAAWANALGMVTFMAAIYLQRIRELSLPLREIVLPNWLSLGCLCLSIGYGVSPPLVVLFSLGLFIQLFFQVDRYLDLLARVGE